MCKLYSPLWSSAELVGPMSSLNACTQAFLDANLGNNITTIPLKVLRLCILNSDLYNDLISLNRTDCLQSVENYEQGITYACTYYYLNVYNQTADGEACRQFNHQKRNYFDSIPCVTIGESLAELFSVTTSALDIVAFTLILLLLLYSVVPKRW